MNKYGAVLLAFFLLSSPAMGNSYNKTEDEHKVNFQYTTEKPSFTYAAGISGAIGMLFLAAGLVEGDIERILIGTSIGALSYTAAGLCKKVFTHPIKK